MKVDEEEAAFGFVIFIIGLLITFFIGKDIGEDQMVNKICNERQYDFCEKIESNFKLKGN